MIQPMSLSLFNRLTNEELARREIHDRIACALARLELVERECADICQIIGGQTRFGDLRRYVKDMRSRLPKTRDGAIIELGMTIWRRCALSDSDPDAFAVAGVVAGYEKPHQDEPWSIECRQWSSPACDCYSTQEMALAGGKP